MWPHSQLMNSHVRLRLLTHCGRKRLQLRGQETGCLPNNNERRGKNRHVRTKEILKGYLAFVNVGTFIQSVQIHDHKRTRLDDYMRNHDSLRERDRVRIVDLNL